MSYDEHLVGGLAVILAIASLAVAVGPWSSPYQLRTISAVSRRFGKPVARGVWVAIAIASMTAAVAILSGFRPHYASPTQQVSS